MAAVVLSLVLSISITSCGDDNDEPEGNSIVGTWLLSIQEGDGEYWYCQYVFNSNGTFVVKDWNSDDPEPAEFEDGGIWSISNDMLTLDFQDDYVDTYRFVLDGNTLILFDYEEPGPNVFVRR